MDIYTFLKEIHNTLVGAGYCRPLRLEDMIDEAVAMINAPNPWRITLTDLLASNPFFL